MFARDIARPLRKNDNTLEYLPTQYLSDFIKSRGYHGIEYTSTMHRGGTNLAIFDGSLLECVETSVVDINDIKYSYQHIKQK